MDITVKFNLDICMAKAGIKSYADLARKSGISRASINRYKDGIGCENMTIGILKTLCIVMNCKLDDLIEFKYEL